MLNFDFAAEIPTQKKLIDLMFIATKAGWLYLILVIDLKDVKLIRWAIINGISEQETLL